jgi:hypothetical protein
MGNIGNTVLNFSSWSLNHFHIPRFPDRICIQRMKAKLLQSYLSFIEKTNFL